MRTSLSSLPVEVLEKIFHHITDVADILQTQKLNHRFRDLVRKNWDSVCELRIGFVWGPEAETLTKPLLLLNGIHIGQLSDGDLKQIFELTPNLNRIVLVQDLSRSVQHPLLIRGGRLEEFQQACLLQFAKILDLIGGRIADIAIVGSPMNQSDVAIPMGAHGQLLANSMSSLRKLSLELEPSLFIAKPWDFLDSDSDPYLENLSRLEEFHISTPTQAESIFDYRTAFHSFNAVSTLRRVHLVIRNYDAYEAVRGIPFLDRNSGIRVSLEFRKRNSLPWSLSEIIGLLSRFQLHPKRFSLVHSLTIEVGPEEEAEIKEFAKLLPYILPGLSLLSLPNPASDRSFQLSIAIAESFLRKKESDLHIETADTVYLENQIPSLEDVHRTTKRKQNRLNVRFQLNDDAQVTISAQMYVPKIFDQRQTSESSVLDMHF